MDISSGADILNGWTKLGKIMLVKYLLKMHFYVVRINRDFVRFLIRITPSGERLAERTSLCLHPLPLLSVWARTFCPGGLIRVVCVLRLLVTHSASCSRAYSGSCKDQLEYCYQNTVVGKHTFLQNTEIVVKSVHLFFKENIFEILQCFKQGISSGHCSLAMQVRLFFFMFFFLEIIGYCQLIHVTMQIL